MAIKNRHGFWHYRFKIDGREIAISTGLDATGPRAKANRKLAEDMEASHRVAIIEGRAGIQRLEAEQFSKAVPKFLTHIDAERKTSTARRIHTSMASLQIFFADQMVSMISAGDIDRYKAWRLTEHKVRPVTLRHDLDNLSLFFQWALRANLCRVNPMKAVERPSDADARREHIVSPAEERLYFAHATGNLADVARIILLQGMRPEEVRRMAWERPEGAEADVDGKPRYSLIDFSAKLIRIVDGKTKKAARNLRMTPETEALLLRRSAEKTGLWVFPGDSGPITKLNCPHDRVLENLNLCLSCGLPERAHKGDSAKCRAYASPARRVAFVLYDLRHTFATRMIRAGVSIIELSKIMGHSSIKVTERYVHLQQSDMDAAMDVYSRSMEQAAGKEIVQ